MKLLIVSHTPHYRQDAAITGWGPTVREIDYLAQVFHEIVHIAPLHPGPVPSNVLAYTSERVRLRLVEPAGGNTLREKIGILGVAPHYAMTIMQEMRTADLVHLRCPAAISLVALCIISLFPQPGWRWVKYAGNWRPSTPEPWSYAFQRWWLKKGLHRGIVTINGRWPDQPEHIYSFLNPSLSEAETREGRKAGERKELNLPCNFLFVGRVEAAKGVGRLLQVAEGLKKRDLPFILNLVGDGPERPAFARWCREHGIDSQVNFRGWLPRPALGDFYARAHFLLFPTSASEGWPKVLSEAMAYGAVPLAGAVSSIPQILAETGAGAALPPFDIDAFANEVLSYVAHPDRWKVASRAGMAAAPKFTYKHYLNELCRVFHDAWGIELPDRGGLQTK
jgi:glycosyltransferase involved in cell wall biosynthesis